jgi:hypothetical protein
MIRDYMLALLSVPLAPEAVPGRFTTGSPAQWRDGLLRWLTRVRELDRSLDFTISDCDTALDRDFGTGVLSLRTHHPVAATVVLALVVDPHAAPQSTDSDLLVLLACCPQWSEESESLMTAGARAEILLLEPRWSAALLLDDADPLFWGVSAAGQAPSVLDFL